MYNRVFENIIDRKCDKCGKNFVPAPYHAYVDGEKVYCSYTCYNHRHDRPKGKYTRLTDRNKRRNLRDNDSGE